MKIWLISDTHGKHEELVIPNNIDMVISAGDGGTYKNPYQCKIDLDTFIASNAVNTRYIIPIIFCLGVSLPPAIIQVFVPREFETD